MPIDCFAAWRLRDDDYHPNHWVEHEKSAMMSLYSHFFWGRGSRSEDLTCWDLGRTCLVSRNLTLAIKTGGFWLDFVFDGRTNVLPIGDGLQNIYLTIFWPTLVSQVNGFQIQRPREGWICTIGLVNNNWLITTGLVEYDKLLFGIFFAYLCVIMFVYIYIYYTHLAGVNDIMISKKHRSSGSSAGNVGVQGG